MRTITLGIGTLLFGLWMTSPALSQETDVLNGKNSAFASTVDQAVLPIWSSSSVLTTTIAHGKAKRVLKIDAMLTIRDIGAAIPGILPSVNGFGDFLKPFARAIATCSGVTACAVAGTWYFDLDAAEAAHPGSFLGKPITVGLLAGEIAGGPDSIPWDASLSVLMVRK